MTDASHEDPNRHLRAVDAEIDGLQMAIDKVKSQKVSAAIEEDQPTPHARVPMRAQEMMDWLRADMSGRFFGVEAMTYVALEQVARFERPSRDPLSIGSAIGSALSGSAHIALPEVARKDAYRLEELMGFHDEAFVRNAYMSLVRREPTPEENQRWLQALLAGETSRQEVLGAVRYSKEGKQSGVQVAGLRLVMVVRKLRRIPGFWRLIGIAQYIVQLPILVRNLEALTARVQRQSWNLDASVAGILHDLRQVHRRLEEDGGVVGSHFDHMAGQLAALRKSDQAMRSWIGTFGENLVSAHKHVAELRRLVAMQAPREEVLAISQQTLGSLAAIRASIEATLASVEQDSFQASVRAESLQAALALLDERKATTQWVEESVRRVSDQLDILSRRELALDTQVKRIVNDVSSLESMRDKSGSRHDPALDAFYVDFENKFRGSREDIKSRVAAYLPTIENARQASGNAIVVDIGCGRGEWLELLQENGIGAKGIDANEAMVAECHSRKLKVRKADAIAFLRNAKPESFSAVTGFHIIEHLSFNQLFSLLEESFRVLKAGGVAIFETPNPENVQVGACTFWYDPTHVKPLPPELVKHLAVARGFDRVEIMRLHPFAEWQRLPDGGDQDVRSRLNTVLYGAQDYSVIAHKP